VDHSSPASKTEDVGRARKPTIERFKTLMAADLIGEKCHLPAGRAFIRVNHNLGSRFFLLQ
jgi:hypothetical protein